MKPNGKPRANLQLSVEAWKAAIDIKFELIVGVWKNVTDYGKKFRL